MRNTELVKKAILPSVQSRLEGSVQPQQQQPAQADTHQTTEADLAIAHLDHLGKGTAPNSWRGERKQAFEH